MEMPLCPNYHLRLEIDIQTCQVKGLVAFHILTLISESAREVLLSLIADRPCKFDPRRDLRKMLACS